MVHFTIDDIAAGEESVDRRMADEMAAGRAALAKGAPPRETLLINAGGPYGSDVLRGVQAAADKVWKTIEDGSVDAGKTWLRANIAIQTARGGSAAGGSGGNGGSGGSVASCGTNRQWTATPILPGGSMGAMFSFPKRVQGGED